MCTLYHQGKDQAQPDIHTSDSLPNSDQQSGAIHVTNSNINFDTIPEDLSPPDVTLGQVWVANPYQVICIPANSVKVVQGRTSRKAQQLSCMIEGRSQNNLPLGSWSTVPQLLPAKPIKCP